MKTIILILLVVGLIGCSQYSLFSKKPQEVHKKEASKQDKMKTTHMSMGIPFKSTLSSLMPMIDSEPDMDMSWQEMLKNYFMNSHILVYIFFGISFIIIARLGYVGARNKMMLKSKMK